MDLNRGLPWSVVYELRTVRQAARADLGMSQSNQTVCYETVQLRPKMGVC